MKCLKRVLVAGSFLVVGSVSILNAADLMVTNNLFLRLDGAHVTADANGVSTWSNQVSGIEVSADFVQSVTGSRPLLVSDAVAGNPALEFDGSADHLYDLTDTAWEWDYDSNSNNVARWTTFFVCKPDVKTANRFLLRSAYNDIAEGSTTRANTALWGVWFDRDDYSVHCRSSSGAWFDARWANAVAEQKWQIVAGRIQNIVDPAITSMSIIRLKR